MVTQTTLHQSLQNQNDSSAPSLYPCSMQDLIDALPQLAHTIRVFSEAREWSKFHTPRNIILALLGEVGELAELLQWKSDDCHEDDDKNSGNSFLQKLTTKELDKLSQELADVSIYLLRLATVTDVVPTLADAMIEHM